MTILRPMKTPDHLSRNKQTVLRKLQQKKHRYREQLFSLEGVRAVEQVIQNNWPNVSWLCFDEEQHLWELPEWQPMLDRFRTYRLEANIFREVTDTQNPQGVLAVCELPDAMPWSYWRERSGVLAAFDQIRDPGNLGTMIRTAAWFGCEGILIGKGSIDPFHPKVVRSTAGATGALHYSYGDLPSGLDELEDDGWDIFMLEEGEESIPINQAEVSDKTILVVGSEAHGLDPDIAGAGRQKVAIPAGNPDESLVESLNAGIALGVGLYAFTKVNKRL